MDTILKLSVVQIGLELMIFQVVGCVINLLYPLYLLYVRTEHSFTMTLSLSDVAGPWKKGKVFQKAKQDICFSLVKMGNISK